jgi:hypothetical protein
MSDDFDLLSMPDDIPSTVGMVNVSASAVSPQPSVAVACSTTSSSFDDDEDEDTVRLRQRQQRQVPQLLSDAIHPQKYSMKMSRRNKTAVGAVSGALVGTMVFPVVGTVVGGYVGGYTINKIHKSGERRAQRKWEQTSFQATARQSPVVNAEFV